MFWRQRLWPKLASHALGFCRRKSFLQWYPDQSDSVNAQLSSAKLGTKFPSTSPLGYSVLRIAHPRWCFLRNSWTGSKPNGGSNAFLGRLELIWFTIRLEMSKLSKTMRFFFPKSAECQRKKNSKQHSVTFSIMQGCFPLCQRFQKFAVGH